MERYRPFENSLEARQFDSVMLRDTELKSRDIRDIRQAISLSAKSRCLVTQCNHCANKTTPNQVRSLRRGQNRFIWTFSSQVFEITGTGDQQRRTIKSLYGFYSSKVVRFEMKNINSRIEEFLKMCCVCRRLTRTTNNNPA